MKTILMTLSLAVVLSFTFMPPIKAQDAGNANATTDGTDQGASFQMFYDQLANQGTWIQTDQYGYVFQPKESDPNWRPYTYGHWVSTEQGLTWVSDDSFGWATDHYGRWTNIDGYGWVWVPGYTWAPAWVSWREDADDVGWAPLPPASDEGIDYYNDDDYFTDADVGFGFHIGDDCDLAYGIGPYWYNFCPIAFIGDRDCWRHFRDRRDNFAFIGHTRNVTNINFRRDGAGRFGNVRVEGPNVAALNARSSTPIPNAQLAAATRLNEAGLRGSSLAVFAPRINSATDRTARPASVGTTLAGTNVNRGTDINRPLAVNSRIAPERATADQVHAASLNAGTTASNARVATAATHVSRPLSQPLTSLRTASTAAPRIYSSGVSTVPRTSRVTSADESRFSGESVRQQPVFSTRPESVFSTPGSFSGNYRTSAPAFHYSAPSSSYHPQQSFQSFTPAAHYSAPAAHYSAPAAHYSAPAEHFSGGFSGGSRGGGGAVSSGGGGRSGGGSGHR